MRNYGNLLILKMLNSASVHHYEVFLEFAHLMMSMPLHDDIVSSIFWFSATMLRHLDCSFKIEIFFDEFEVILNISCSILVAKISQPILIYNLHWRWSVNSSLKISFFIKFSSVSADVMVKRWKFFPSNIAKYFR